MSLLVLAIAALITGCSTPEPTRYFQLDLRLEIDKKPYEVTYNWHCWEVMDGPNFGPGGILKARWVWAPPTYAVLKKIEKDSVILFQPKPYCGDGAYEFGPDGKASDPPITLIDSARYPTLMQIFTQRTPHGLGHDVSVKSATVKRLINSSPDYVASEDEKLLKQSLQDNSHGYHSVSARVIPESVWGKSDTVRQYFKDADGVLIAPTPTKIRSNIVGSDGRYNYFPVDQSGIYPGADFDSYTVPLIRNDGFWRLPSLNNFSMASIYYEQAERPTESGARRYDIGSPPVATVNYDGTSIQVLGSQQIFDSKRRLLIQFINSFQPLPWIGNRQ
jgi:hypothetical protein